MPSNSTISLGIEVDGEKTFNSALSAIDQQIKALGAGVQSTIKQMDAMGDSEELSAKKTDLLAKSIEANQQKLSLLQEKSAAAKERLAELARAFEEAQKSGDSAAIDRAANAYNRQAGEVARLEGQMRKTEGAIADATKGMNAGAEAAEKESTAMQQTGSQSDELASKISRMSAIMTTEFAAKAAGAVVDAFKSIISGAIDAGKAILDITTTAGTYADTMLTLAEQTSVDPIDLQKWEYASQFIDTEVSTITGSLTKLTKNMASESAATGEAFAALGISVRDSTGNLRDSETVMWETIDALGNVENQTQRDALAMTIFGKSAQELNPLINAGSEAFRALGTEAENAGLILGGEALSNLGAVDDAMNRVNSSITGVQNAVAVAFAPAVTELANGANEVVQAMIGMVNGTEGSSEQFVAAIDNLVNTAIRLLNDMLPIILDTGVKIITSLVTGISNNISKITQTITNVIKELLSTLAAHLPDILSAGVDILIAIIDGIIQAIPQLVSNLPQIISAIVDGLAKLAPRLWEAGKNIIVGLWEGIKTSISWLWEKIKEALGSVFGWLLDLLGIHSPSTLMRDQVGKMLGLGMAEGIIDSAGIVQRAFDSLMPDPARLTASVDGYSVAARVASQDGGRTFWQDDRPIILRLNDRELGRAVRGYV